MGVEEKCPRKEGAESLTTGARSVEPATVQRCRAEEEARPPGSRGCDGLERKAMGEKLKRHLVDWEATAMQERPERRVQCTTLDDTSRSGLGRWMAG